MINKRFPILLSILPLLFSCGGKTAIDEEEYYHNGTFKMPFYSFKEGDKERFEKLKEAYYKQRFVDSDNNIYSLKTSSETGCTEKYEHYIKDESLSYNGLYSNDYFNSLEIKINSVDDLVLHASFLYQNDDGIEIVSFSYTAEYPAMPGAWLSIGCFTNFIDEEMVGTCLLFSGSLFLPEVYYQGSFYYVHEAYELGIFDLNNESLWLDQDITWYDENVSTQTGLTGRRDGQCKRYFVGI